MKDLYITLKVRVTNLMTDGAGAKEIIKTYGETGYKIVPTHQNGSAFLVMKAYNEKLAAIDLSLVELANVEENTLID